MSKSPRATISCGVCSAPRCGKPRDLGSAPGAAARENGANSAACFISFCGLLHLVLEIKTKLGIR
jgi:hypothetical protein